jgi:hypothetical protein
MIKAVLLHFPRLDPSSLGKYTFESHKVDYPKAKADFEVFDGLGNLVFQGREFHSGTPVVWRPSYVSTSMTRPSVTSTLGGEPVSHEEA